MPSELRLAEQMQLHPSVLLLLAHPFHGTGGLARQAWTVS